MPILDWLIKNSAEVVSSQQVLEKKKIITWQLFTAYQEGAFLEN